MEHESDGDTNCNWCIRNGLHKNLKEVEIRERAKTIQITTLLRSNGILRRILETWGDLLSLRLHWKTISEGWCEKLARSKVIMIIIIIIIIVIIYLL